MKKGYVIGVDIGGTNTDAVLVNRENQIVSWIKTTTSEDIQVGFSKALQELIEKSKILPEEISGIFVGTTHATNAILQMKDLYRVGVIRIAGQKPSALPPGFSWPAPLKEKVIASLETINGGFECHGGELQKLSIEEIDLAILRLLEQNIESIAIIGVFSPLNGSHEQFLSERIRRVTDLPISLSHEIGGIGFIERENSTIINASLQKVMRSGFSSLKRAAEGLMITSPLMVTQNDGSLISLEKAMTYPILTISAGPTNSFIGGARLFQVDEAIVVDIGGTSTDVGLLKNGFPLKSLNKSDIGGISLNFSMPDVLSIALGGGSKISFDQERPIIGPDSVAKSLTKDAKSFGGKELTLTDVALSSGHMTISNANPQNALLTSNERDLVFEEVQKKIDQLILSLNQEGDLPILFVGGGSALLPPSYFQKNYFIPSYFHVANAYGAALSEISGTVETLVSLTKREETLNELHEMAKKEAIDQGADQKTLRLIEQEILPYSYVPGQMARVRIRYSGKRDGLLT